MPDLQPDNPRVLAVLDAIPWTWRYGLSTRRLGYDHGEKRFFAVSCDSENRQYLDNEEALSLIERRLRVWLPEHRAFISPLYDKGKFMAWSLIRHGTGQMIMLRFGTTDYLTAQITAAEAVLAETKDIDKGSPEA